MGVYVGVMANASHLPRDFSRYDRNHPCLPRRRAGTETRIGLERLSPCSGSSSLAAIGGIRLGLDEFRWPGASRRPWDYNLVGAAHAGMVPNPIENLRLLGAMDADMEALLPIGAEELSNQASQVRAVAPLLTPGAPEEADGSQQALVFRPDRASPTGRSTRAPCDTSDTQNGGFEHPVTSGSEVEEFRWDMLGLPATEILDRPWLGSTR